jgi:CheY-like chemotaxis protein
MHVLIVEENQHRGEIWKRFLNRQGAKVTLVPGSEQATSALYTRKYDALVINIVSAESSVLAVSDLASYRNPDIAIITITSGSFFSDGSIFGLIPNARSCVSGDVPPKDLADMVTHFGSRSSRPASGGLPS